ncbi:MAG: hypothetical protein QE271_00635 [Bacteriovoracaceae bacterium]|nr:hypothetical protein [Bacteriovoracaceae bacterium]
MKFICLICLLCTSLSVLALEEPNFEEIFREIKGQTTVTESIKVRGKYLKKMRNLSDFNRLTDLEVLNEGEDYFNNYHKAISDFILKNVRNFILDRKSIEEQDVFTYQIINKAYDQKSKNQLLDLGLVYVDSCEDFYRYAHAARAENIFLHNYNTRFCHRVDSYPSQFPSGLIEIITNTVLRDGEYKQIFLPRFMFVSKIYISARGMNSNAQFDVMVNGDIKGTIFVPGRDPLYIVNVSTSTNSIELRSLMGSAEIISLKVDY